MCSQAVKPAALGWRHGKGGAMAREMVTGALSVVITGASAGVGRATALAFGRTDLLPDR